MKRYEHTHCERPSGIRKIILGIIIIAIGALLLAKNLGYLPQHVSEVIFSWQMLLIAIGFINLFGRNTIFSGLILITIGTFFILPNVCNVPVNFTQVFWPVIFIIAGIFIIARWNKRGSIHSDKWHFKAHQHWDCKPTDNTIATDIIEEVNIFSGTKRNLAIQDFKGGSITCVFGGSDLDLSKCQLADGVNILEVACVFGGVNLIIPSNWNVRVEVASIMGGFADKRVANFDTSNSSKQLIIKGATIFGGGALKSD